MDGRWEVQFGGADIEVTVEQPDGTIVAGGAGMESASIFLASGGRYKLRITPSPDSPHAPWRVKVVPIGPPGGTMTASTDIFVPPDMKRRTLASVSPDGVVPIVPQATRGGGTVSGGAGTPDSGVPIVGSLAAGTPTTPPAPAAPPVKITDAQARALVLIKGDNSEGTGFLVRLPTGPVVVTNLHVIAANPHLQITTSGGQSVKFSGLQGASDRDLAMIPIQDDHYSYLEMATDLVSAVQVGDQVVTPGNSLGGDTLLNTGGTIVSLGPQKVEISNPVYHGNSGGPIIHVKSGKVIGVVTEGMKVDADNTLDKASFQNQNSAITSQMRYFGLRLDTVTHWDIYTWQRFENETEFLSEFRERSKCLDSYLNTGLHDQTEWGLYYLKDDKVKAANESLAEMGAEGSDTAQRIDAERNLIFTLGSLADADMDQMQQPSNFYSFDQQRARDEVGYRKALKKEIDGMSSDVGRVGALVRRN
jgi:S1-C subfamily serine protease